MSTLATLRHHWAILATSWAQENKTRRDRRQLPEAHAFLPAALEVLETPPNPLGRLLIWTMLGITALALAWTCLGKIDVVVSAKGKLIPIGWVKVVQSANEGVVRNILTRDGEHVRRGQVLIELDPTQSGADAAQALAALRTAEIDAAHANALLRYAGSHGSAFTTPAGVSSAEAETQRQLIASEIAAYEAQQADLNAKRAESAALAEMAERERAKLADTLPLLHERVTRRQALVEKGWSSKLNQLELEEQELTHQRDIGVQAESGLRYHSATRAIEMQLAEARASFVKDAAALLAKAQGEIALRQEELRKATQRSQLQQLRSPVDGDVQQLSLHTLGAVVKAGDPILVVVPSARQVTVNAQVLNRDVGQLRLGQAAAIKLDAFPFTRYGTLPGRLIDLSHDAVDDEKLGLVYQARVAVRCREDGAGDLRQASVGYLCARLGPGMATTVDIKTDRRRIISFLLSPIERRLAEAGHER